MKILFATDYNGKDQKAELLEGLGQYGQAIDVTQQDSALTNYVLIADRVANLVAVSDSIGVLMCGTGGGTSLVANKHKGAYAIRCLTPKDAEEAKLINNANILCLSAQTPIEANKAIIKAFFETQYAGRKPERLDAIRQIEDQNFA